MTITQIRRARGWHLTKPSPRPEHGSAGPDPAGETAALWTALTRAQRGGWQASRPTYNPDTRLWSVWAVPPASLRVLPIRGFGGTAAAAVLDLATRFQDRYGTKGR